MRDADVVVIGSGAGGLAAAVALARAGERVLVLEQHYLPGGWCHSFPLEGYRFSPGVHYVGQLQEGGSLRKIYEGLGLGADLTFYELDPAGFDHVHLGEERFDIPRGKEAWIEALAARVPAERRGIRGYLDAVEALDAELGAAMRTSGPLDLLTLPFRAPTLLRWGLRTGGSMIDAFVRDPLARGVLAAQAGDHGLPPSQASAAVHAAVQAHYFHGAWYPKGGGAALPRAHIKALKAHGGDLRIRTPVEEILVEDGRAAGVRLADGSTLRAGAVISNADPGVTYGRLLPAEHQSGALRRKLARQRYSVSAVSLFMAARIDPEAHGLDSGNTWLFPDADVDGAYTRGLGDWVEQDGPVPGMFLTVTTLKDPSHAYGDVHTMEAFCFAGAGSFDRWAGTASGERPADYEAFKRRLEGRMLDALERRIPGLRDALVFSALGTPLTNTHYCAATEGSLYGTAKLRSQVGPLGFGIRSELPGLYLCGASTLAHGVMGATRSGIAAACAALECRPREVLAEGGPAITLLDAEAERRGRAVTPAGG